MEVFLTFSNFQKFILQPKQINGSLFNFVKFQKFIIKSQQNNGYFLIFQRCMVEPQ